LEQAKSLFYKLRVRIRKPPYKMDKFRRTFITDFMAHASDADPEAAFILENTLSWIWEEFREERLKARPVTTLCIACKKKQESKEKVKGL